MQLKIVVTLAKIVLKNPICSSEKWVHQKSMDNYRKENTPVQIQHTNVIKSTPLRALF